MWYQSTATSGTTRAPFSASDSNMDRYMDFINKAKLFESVCKIGAKVEGIKDLPFFKLVESDKRFSTEL